VCRSNVVTAKAVGGALGIGVCDRLLMLQYSTYSVISPEGCASSVEEPGQEGAAADALNLTAMSSTNWARDEVIEEPLAERIAIRRDVRPLKAAVIRRLEELKHSTDELRAARSKKLHPSACFRGS